MSWFRHRKKLRKTDWKAQLKTPGAGSNTIDWAFVDNVGCGCQGCRSSYVVYRRVMPLLRESEVRQIKRDVRKIVSASHPNHSACIDGAI